MVRIVQISYVASWLVSPTETFLPLLFGSVISTAHCPVPNELPINCKLQFQKKSFVDLFLAGILDPSETLEVCTN